MCYVKVGACAWYTVNPEVETTIAQRQRGGCVRPRWLCNRFRGVVCSTEPTCSNRHYCSPVTSRTETTATSRTSAKLGAGCEAGPETEPTVWGVFLTETCRAVEMERRGPLAGRREGLPGWAVSEKVNFAIGWCSSHHRTVAGKADASGIWWTSPVCTLTSVSRVWEQQRTHTMQRLSHARRPNPLACTVGGSVGTDVTLDSHFRRDHVDG